MTTTNDETPLKAHSRSWSSWATRRCCSTPALRSPRSSWLTVSANCPIRTPRSRKTRTQATPACSKGLLFSFDATVSESSGISRYGTARSLPNSFLVIFLADTQYLRRVVLLLRRNVVPYPADRDIRAPGGAQHRQNPNRLRGHLHSSSATHVCCPAGCIAKDRLGSYGREHGRHGRPWNRGIDYDSDCSASDILIS